MNPFTSQDDQPPLELVKRLPEKAAGPKELKNLFQEPILEDRLLEKKEEDEYFSFEI